MQSSHIAAPVPIIPHSKPYILNLALASYHESSPYIPYQLDYLENTISRLTNELAIMREQQNQINETNNNIQQQLQNQTHKNQHSH